MKKIKMILVAFIATLVTVGAFAVSVSADELTPVADVISVAQPVVDDTTEIIVPSSDGWNVVETPVAELVTPATETPDEPVAETPEVPATPVVDDTPIIEPKTDEPEVPAEPETPAEPTVPTPVADLVVEPKPEPTPVTPDPEPVKPVQPVDDTPIIEPKKEEPKTPETPKVEEPKVPETPKKEEPKTPKESPKEEPKVEEPKVPSTPETVEVPSVPTTVAEKPQAASVPVAKATKKRTRLPMTGENSNPTLLLVGLTALMLATGLKVKKVEY